MKKRMILLLAVLMGTAMAMAQSQETRIPSGYQGFLEQGNTYAFNGDEGVNTTGFSTTHGFYFGGHTFVGVGLAMIWGDEYFAMPIYTSVKYIFRTGKVMSPFVQLRLGSCVSDDIGTYSDMAVGLRFASKRDFAVNVMLAGTYVEPLMKETTTHYYSDGSVRSDEWNVKPSGIGFRVGIEW